MLVARRQLWQRLEKVYSGKPMAPQAGVNSCLKIYIKQLFISNYKLNVTPFDTPFVTPLNSVFLVLYRSIQRLKTSL